MNEMRYIFLDKLKVFLMMLVVVHHAGQPYGSNGWWYFKENEMIPKMGSFFSINASFSMSLFFLISAYFIPASVDRRGISLYLRERLVRLGIPLLLGFLFIIPMLMYTYYLNFRGYDYISYASYFLNIFLGFGSVPENWTGPSWPDMQFGHLWFIEHLLLYTFMYILVRKLVKSTVVLKVPSNLSIVLFGLVVSLLTFTIRIWYPIDYWVGFLGIIQTEFAHVPQYILFFSLGILAYRNKWLLTFSKINGQLWLAVGLFLAGLNSFGSTYIYSYVDTGGFNYKSLFWSTIESFMGLGLIIGLLILFRETADYEGNLSKTLASNTFIVYIIHVPIVVLFQFLVSSLPISALDKFIVVSLLGIVFSFLISNFIIRKLIILNKT